MKILNTLTAVVSAGLISTNILSQSLTPVSSFGSNPGSLNMYTYVPTGISSPAALVVAMHGCTETAAIYAAQSGWDKLADRHKFYMVYPEQISANNSSMCFNWFDATDQSRSQGEALSIKQMVDYMKSHYSIDTTKIFVTGLSAGAGMTSVMLAAYPEIFNKGAIMAGLPYKAATSSATAGNAMYGWVTKTPAQWSALVKNENPSYTGPFPHAAIFHGTSDLVVNINNATELIKQWTDLNNADQTADSTNTSFQGNSLVEETIYNDNANKPVVYYYKITSMGHGISLDTGSCPRQGGTTGTYALEEHFNSTYQAAHFFNILKNPYSITGAIQVNENATNVTYSVVNTAGSTYSWAVPAGAIIAGGQGTHSITVNFATASGNVTVQETTGAGCKNDIASLYVTVQFNVSVSQTSYLLCHNSSSGAALAVAASGGTGPYTYSWSPSGGTNITASGLAAGVYTVTVTDHANVVVASSGFTVTPPALITASQTRTLCAGQSINVGSHTYNSSNTYTDTLSALNSCDSVLTTHLTVYPLTPVSLSISGNDSLCSAASAFVLSGGSPSGGVYSGAGISSGNFNPAGANIGWDAVTYTFIDANNCPGTAKDSIYISNCITTGLTDSEVSKNIRIYPNPAAGAVNIAIDGGILLEVKIYNSAGALVLVKQFNRNKAELDIHTLPEGLYLLNLKTDKGIITRNILKQ